MSMTNLTAGGSTSKSFSTNHLLIQTDLKEVRPLAISTGPITGAEVKNALKTLKNGTAVGFDNIPPETWKERGRISLVLVTLLNKIWKVEEIPMDRMLRLLVKLPEKGDLSDCANSRGIMLSCYVNSQQSTQWDYSDENARPRERKTPR